MAIQITFSLLKKKSRITGSDTALLITCSIESIYIQENLNLMIIANHIENQTSLEGLVEEISGKGLKAMQLALDKSYADMNTNVGSLSPGFARHIGNAFRKKDVQIVFLGCYIPMIHPDKEKRKIELERFKEPIRFARDFGCSIIERRPGTSMKNGLYNREFLG